MSKAPEPIILSVVLVLVALGVAGLAYTFPTVQDITGIKSTEPAGQMIAPLKQADIEASLAIWTKPDFWSVPTVPHRLFDSDQYLFWPTAYPNGNYIAKMDKDTRAPSGVLLSWYLKNKLDFTDPNVDHEDPDGDGFSNIVEFRNEAVGVRRKAADCDGSDASDPRDATSHPSYLSRLRLQKYELRPFHIVFTGYQQLNGAYLFQLSLADVESWQQPQLKKSGDELGFEGYVIGPFNQAFQDITNTRTHVVEHTDVSTLELDKPDIGLKVVLPFRQTINSPESTANFVLLLPTEVDKVIKVARGKIFSLPAPYDPQNSYVVIDAGDNGATIRDVKTNKTYSILKLDPAEWNEVPVLPQNANGGP